MAPGLQIHARLGEIHYMAATASGTGGGEDTYESHMAESVKRFCRSIELCDDYLRGYYGLKIVGFHIVWWTGPLSALWLAR